MNQTKVIRSVFLLSILFAPGFAYAKKADIIELQNAVKTLDSRLQRLESRSDNQALIELYKTIETLKDEVQSLRGEIEQLSNEIDGVSKRQRDMYLDIDRRLNDMNITAPVSRPKPNTDATDMPSDSTINTDMSNNTVSVDSKQERDDYGAAFKFLREGRYSEAVGAFKEFIKQYPNGRYAENAQYWLGEANYASRQFDQALIEFDKVLKAYPGSTKVPGAKLKMGYTYYELERWREARDILNDVLRNYPSSSVAPLAEKRLIRMTTEGH